MGGTDGDGAAAEGADRMEKRAGEAMGRVGHAQISILP